MWFFKNLVCLSNIHYNIVKKIFALIYGGAVEVPVIEMRAFIRAAKFLKLQGFENISPTVSIDDIEGADQIQPRRNYSIRLKRIDEADLAMNTTTSNQPMTNGVAPHGENNDNGGNGSSSSSSNSNAVNGIGNAVNGNEGGEGDVDDNVDVEIDIDGDGDRINGVGNDNNIICIENRIQLSSSSSSESDAGSFQSPSDSEHSG